MNPNCNCNTLSHKTSDHCRAEASTTCRTFRMGFEPSSHVYRMTSVTAVQTDGRQAFDGQVAQSANGPLSAVPAERGRGPVTFGRQRPAAFGAVASYNHRAEVVPFWIVDTGSRGHALVHLSALCQHAKSGMNKRCSFREHSLCRKYH